MSALIFIIYFMILILRLLFLYYFKFALFEIIFIS